MKKLGYVLMMLGATMCLIPSAGNIYTHCKQQYLYENYLKHQVVSDKGDDRFNKQVIDSNQKQEKNMIHTLTNQGVQNNTEINVIGKLNIESIDLNIILLDGEDKENLALGACHMVQTAYPGEVGNTVIAGHRNYVFGSMFNRLGEVQLEDKISIEVAGTTYDYKVTDIFIVEPTDVSVLKQPTDKKEITLITCHPLHTGTHRLIIKGIMMEET